MNGFRNMLLSLMGREAAGLATTANVSVADAGGDAAGSQAAAAADGSDPTGAAAQSDDPADAAAAEAAAAAAAAAPPAAVDAPAAAAPDPQPSAADAVAAERARLVAVFSSEHVKGREAMAVKMIQTSMSADEIIGILGETPKADAANGVLAALASQRNPNLGTGGNEEPSNHSQDLWDKAIAGLTPKRA